MTVVAAYSDETAPTALTGTRALGLAAPGDVAVISVAKTSLTQACHSKESPGRSCGSPPTATIATDRWRTGTLEWSTFYAPFGRLTISRVHGVGSPRRPAGAAWGTVPERSSVR